MKKIFFLLLLPIILFSNVINLSSLNNNTNIFNKVSIFVEEKALYKLEEIQSKKFTSYKKTFIKKGFSDEVIWLKFKIKNDTNKNQIKMITTDNYILNSLTLFTKTQNKITIKKDGIHRTNFRTILRPYFEIELLPNETKEYILKISSKSTPLNFSLLLLDKDSLYDEEFRHQLILALFFGSILTLITYNLMVFIFSKDITYIYYVLYLTALTIYYLYYSNMLFYVIGFSPNFIGVYILSFMLLFIILFMKNFLSLKKYSIINKTLNIVLIILLCIIIFVNEDFYPIKIIVIFYLFILFYILFTAYYLLNKQIEARYFIVGWTIAIIGFVNLAFFNLGFPNFIEKYPYFYELTIFLEGIIFSVALVNKLNTTKRLALEVEKNKILIKEIHHRVKNNMQFIISLYRIKLNHKMDDELSQSITDIENTIQSMGKAYEMLYQNDNLEYIDVNKYFKTLINELKNVFDLSKIKIHTNIKEDLSINQAITCGIIVNEALTNSLKYAFNDTKGEIQISLIKSNGKFNLKIKDNGIGLENKNQNGFGLFLLENLVKTNLKGKFEIKSKNGVEIDIVF